MTESNPAPSQFKPIRKPINEKSSAGKTVTKKTTVRTETRNGKTIKTTTVVENGVTTVTTEEY